MGLDPISIAAGTTAVGIGAKKVYDYMTMDLPEMPTLPGQNKAVDIKPYKKKISERKGRSSTILGSQTLGLSGDKKTVLG